jgi:hypothetical protein
MASLYLRDLSDTLVKAVRMKALAEGKRISELVVPMLELLVNSQPVTYAELKNGFDAAEKPTLARPKHAAGCKCGTCKPVTK